MIGLRVHKRIWTLAGILTLIAGLGASLSLAPRVLHVSQPVAPEEHVSKASPPASAPVGHERDPRAKEIEQRFNEAVVMLHAKRFDYAMTALHRVLELNPRLPEAHVNMGYALLGLEQFRESRDFFLGAVGLKPDQWNAYYGLAIAYEELGAMPEAIGAMRTYVHLAPPESKFLSKARAALWEWESQAGNKGGQGPGPSSPAAATPVKGSEHGAQPPQVP